MHALASVARSESRLYFIGHSRIAVDCCGSQSIRFQMLRCFVLTALLCNLFCLLGATSLRGVDPDKAGLYEGEHFRCFDGKKVGGHNS